MLPLAGMPTVQMTALSAAKLSMKFVGRKMVCVSPDMSLELLRMEVLASAETRLSSVLVPVDNHAVTASIAVLSRDILFAPKLCRWWSLTMMRLETAICGKMQVHVYKYMCNRHVSDVY